MRSERKSPDHGGLIKTLDFILSKYDGKLCEGFEQGSVKI